MAGQWILWFEEFGREDTNRVGSKCANIGEMAKIGIPVPPGFAVTTEMYDEFLAKTGAGQRMEQYLIKLPEGPQTLADREEASQTIAEIILTAEMPKDLEDAVCQAYDELCQKCQISDVAVAVRSSGVAEDLPTASFAGQYETYLNVRGKDDLLEKIRRCWASLFTVRAISYRIQNKLSVLAGSISVAVQKMVNVRSAGVGFTIHPTTGDDTKIVLEGNWGAGESVVQGIVTPDRFMVDKDTLTLAEKQVSQKMRQIVLKERGVEEEDVPPDMQSVPCLSDEEALRIAELAKSIELHYGSSQDIEWVVDCDFPFPRNIFLVQTRPVTVIVKKKTSELIVDSMLRRLLRQPPRG